MSAKILALCVPTVGHADVVRDVLSNCIRDYFEFGVDVYYFDSSEDEDTYKVIENFKNQGYDNLYYVDVDVNYSLREKMEMIYGRVGLCNEYDYIWPAKDRSFIPVATLKRIMENITDEHDFIMLASNFDRELSKTYENAVDYYKDWAWLATSLDSIIYKTSTTLSDYDSEKFNAVYEGEYLRSWSVYEYIFSKMAQLSENGHISIKTLTGEDIVIYNSELGKSMWDKKTFTIWKDFWIIANEKLPACYSEYKDMVIKKTASLPWIMGSVDRLIKLHDMGVLVPEALENIEENWERVSDIPLRKLREIAHGKYDVHHDLDNFSKGQDEVVDLLVEMSGLLKDEKMKKTDFPANDIFKYIINKYDAGKHADNRSKIAFVGTIRDIMLYIIKEDTTIDDMCKGIQILINFLVLI